MEAEVGTPIEYNPDDFTDKDMDNQTEQEPENNEQYYFPPPQHYYEPHPQQPLHKEDIFSNLDK